MHPEEVGEIADQVPAIVTREPLGSVLAVADFSGAEFDRDAVEHIKIATAFDRPHVKRAAWVLTENLPKDALRFGPQVFRPRVSRFSLRARKLWTTW